jgi:polyisoprenoid-binding protein YceI
MKRLITLLVTGFIFLNINAQRLNADNEKTRLEWFGEKVTGDHKGTVNLKSGWLNWADNRITGGEFLIDMASIQDVDKNQKLEGHLKSDDFFGVDKYPVAKLVVTESSPFDKGTARVKGNLTIKENTHPVEFVATMQQKEDDKWFYTNITIDRSKYDIRYGSGSFFENLGDKTIYDEFKLKVALVLN